MNSFTTQTFKPFSSFFLFLFFLLISTKSFATNYYLDPSGNDTNNGTSSSTPWKSLSKFSSTTFSAGDTIFFKAGSVWSGQAWPKGSGASGNPIVVDMYGTGDKPIINGPGSNGSAAFYLEDVSYWEVNNLEVTNYRLAGVDSAQLYGIYVKRAILNSITNFTIKNCYVHDVYAQTYGKPNYGKITGGIIFSGLIHNILVQGCHVKNVQVEGIRTNYSNSDTNSLCRNVVFDNNLIENVYGDGMVLAGVRSGSAITNNVLRNVAVTNDANFAAAWTIASCGSRIAFNEVYDCVGGGVDGEAFDADINAIGDVFEYNYSHNNKGGFMLFMPSAQKITVRYNISQNDGNGTELLHYTNNTYTTNLIYNNTFYIGQGLSTTLFRDGSAVSKTVNFYNNILQADGAVTAFTTGSFTASSVFKNNCYWPSSITLASGAPPQTSPVLADPKLVRPGAGGVGFNTTGMYQLPSTSPCIGAGAAIINNGSRDFWNNALYYNGSADIGAHEYSGSTINPPVVSITSPANNATIPQGNVDINATASDPDGTISKVEFYEGYNLLGEDVSAPYSFTWGNDSLGGHTITAKAIDNAGNAAAISINVTTAAVSDTLFAPVADAYVRDGSYAGTNFGTGTTMVVKSDAVGYNRQSYMRFNYGAFPDTTTASAILRLYVSGVNTAATRVISVYGVADTTWGETTITWNNKPAAGTLLGSITVTNQAGLWYQLDVTSYIKANMGTKRVSLFLVNEAAASSTNDVSFNTKEAGSNQPQLTIARNVPAVTALPIADAFVRDGNYANTNYGTSNVLTVKKDNTGFSREMYLKFDLSSLATDVQSAKLRLYVNYANTGVATTNWQLYYVSNDTWTETGINWNNKPATTSLLTTIPGQATGTAAEWDISSQVLSEMGGDKILTLKIVSTVNGGKTDASFNSKEATANLPQIVIARRGGLMAIKDNYARLPLMTQVQHGFFAYPNPVKEMLHIQVPEAKGQIRLTDIAGKTIQQDTVTHTNMNMYLHGVSAGVYFISYSIDGKIINSQKIIVQ